MASLKHSQDKTFYVLRDPSGENQSIVTDDENEAFELWSSDTTWLADSYNPIEGWSLPLADEWSELLERGMTPGTYKPRFFVGRAYSAMRVAAE